jgi:uncharacterized protein (DUF1697 family)
MTPARPKAAAVRYVAFLRAINVGGHVVKMDALRKLFESLRFSAVETFIASGNVIFESTSTDATALEQQIEQQLARALGYPVATFLRTPSDIAAIAAMEPFPPGASLPPALSHYVGFLKTPPSPAAAAALYALATDVDEFRIIGREVHWLLRVRISDSKITGARLEKTLQSPSTFRNITTVQRLALKYPA